ncbi:C39 family peptidase [Sutcliffiella rhizosphaerae]|uniref:Beta-barrel assembly-enhancing protease n=1 Tax=Sutcliffiella rhizosphaerae TaxID=2880967 RepID=A0ABM8YQW4_9BACI|nr:C39 family peptidase [Sutcliffiella rhizosphaerae]CAG9622385.1 Beta-barrel assembly-enhancing protease [Sutcliffiella rhizosphaerae]
MKRNMEIGLITKLLEENKYNEAINYFVTEFKSINIDKPIELIKKVVSLPDDEMRSLLRVLDLALMDRISSLLVRVRFRLNNSIATTIWYGEELIDQGKYIQSWELIKSCLDEDVSNEDKEKIYRALAIACMHMKRFNEAYEHMKNCEEIATEPMDTRWAYYHLKKGESQEGLAILKKALNDPKEAPYAFGMIIRESLNHGDLQNARAYLEIATDTDLLTPGIQAEWIRYYRNMKDWEKLRTLIKALHTSVPFHNYKLLLNLWIAESFYEEKNFKALQAFLEEHKEVRKNSQFKNLTEKVSGNQFVTNYHSSIQKDNFCVPACISMVFSMYGQSVPQEEIAEKVFSVSGSSLIKTIGYLKGNGYTSRYFQANVELVKQLLDVGAAIIMNVEYPSSSHVQLVVGYDDILNTLFIQDPNFPEMHRLDYEKFSEEYGNSKCLAIAVLPNKESQQLSFLDDHFHKRSIRIQSMGENGQKNTSDEEIMYIKENLDDEIVASTYLKYLASEDDKDLIHKAIEVVTKSSLPDDYKHFITAMAYIRLKDWEQAENSIDLIKNNAYQSAISYWRGRIKFDQDDYVKAGEYFYDSILHESEDFVSWSYLALSSYYSEQMDMALAYSTIAMDINSLDTFVRMNHGIILLENHYVEDARSEFQKLIKEDKHHAHAWFERARCDMEMARYRHAERGFKVAIHLDSTIAIPYKELSGLYENIHGDNQRAEDTLKDGMENTGQNALLMMELAAFYWRQEDLQHARKTYMLVTELEPNDSTAWLCLGQLLMEEGKHREAYRWFNDQYGQFESESEYLINAGKNMWHCCEEMEAEQSQREQALAYIEKGIELEVENLEGALDVYVELLIETPYYTRALSFIHQLMEEDEDNYLYPSYIGWILEENEEYYQAIHYFETALTLSYDLFPLYRLGETYVKLSDDKTAKRYFKKVIELDQEHLQAFIRLSDISERLNHKVQEVYYLKKAFQIDPYVLNIDYFASLLKEQDLKELMDQLLQMETEENAGFIKDSLAYIYGYLGELDKEEELVQEALALDKEETNFITHYIKVLIKRKRFSEAKNEWYKQIQKDVEERHLYPLLIDLYKQSNSMLSLEKDLNKLRVEASIKSLLFMYSAVEYEKLLLEQRENDAYDASDKGWIGKIKNFGKATLDFGVLGSLYENAIKLDRTNTDAVILFGDFYLQMDMLTDAVKLKQKSLKVQWTEAVASSLVTTYINYIEYLPEKKHASYLSDAKLLIEKCLEEEYSIENLNHYGYVLRLLEENENAKNIFLEILELDGNNKSAHYHLGVIYRDLGEATKEMQHMNRAVELDGFNAWIMNEASITYRLAGQFTKALELIDSAIEIDPEELHFLYNRACYLSLLKREEEASDLLIEVLEAEEDGAFAAMALEDDDFIPLKKAGMFPLEFTV